MKLREMGSMTIGSRVKHSSFWVFVPQSVGPNSVGVPVGPILKFDLDFGAKNSF